MALPEIASRPATPGAGAAADSEDIFSLTGTSDGMQSKAVLALAETLRARLGRSAAKLLEMLRQWDIDGEGFVTQKEFRVAMRTLQVRRPRPPASVAGADGALPVRPTRSSLSRTPRSRSSSARSTRPAWAM